MMPVLSIAGAGTDIGKTYVAVALIQALRRCGVAIDALKPVASGYTDDTATASDPGRLLQALGLPLEPATLDRICPLRFAAPLSPPLAARLEGRRIDYAAVRDMCRVRAAATSGLLIVETAGGVMSPLSDDHTMLDLMADLGAPVVLVAGSYLGAISHALTALTVLRHAGLTVAAIALSESDGTNPDFDETQIALQRLAGAVPIVPFPRNIAPDQPADALAAHLAGL